MNTSVSSHSVRAARVAGLVGVAILTAAYSAGAAKGAIVMTIAPSGGSVVATATGTANISGVAVIHTTDLQGPGVSGDFGGFIRIGGAPSANTTLILGTSGPGMWVSPLLQLTLATSSSEGVDLVGARDSGRQVYLPGGYVSDTPLNASSTWSGATIDSLGLTRGSYTWTWGTGPNADSLTVNVIPEPCSALLWLGAIAAAGLRRASSRRSCFNC